MRKEIKFNSIVNYDKDCREVTVLDYVFDDGENFKGAVGTTFDIISKAEHRKWTTLESMESYLEGTVQEEDIPIQFRESATGKSYKYPYRRWAQEIKDKEESTELMFDTSYCELWDYMREELGLSEKEAYIFSCSGGGRCFNDRYEGNFNKELSEIIRSYENKNK